MKDIDGKIERFISRIKADIKKLPFDYRVMCDLILETGCRVGEIKEVELIGNNFLYFKSFKGGKDRLIKVRKKLYDNLYLFNRKSKRALEYELKELGVTPHILRYFFVFENRGNPEKIQFYLGHKNKKSTMGYIKRCRTRLLSISKGYSYRRNKIDKVREFLRKIFLGV